jgi:hypothetical protein
MKKFANNPITLTGVVQEVKQGNNARGDYTQVKLAYVNGKQEPKMTTVFLPGVNTVAQGSTITVNGQETGRSWTNADGSKGFVRGVKNASIAA